MSDAAIRADSRWRFQEQLNLPSQVRDWLSDPGSLTARLRQYGVFRVAPQHDRIIHPTRTEQQLLDCVDDDQALIREVTLMVNEQPVVEARSVLPLSSLTGANKSLGQMGNRSLGSELYRPPKAHRDQVWVRYGTSPSGQGPCWGRQSRFIKRHRPLLVAEHFLPTLWQMVEQTDH